MRNLKKLSLLLLAAGCCFATACVAPKAPPRPPRPPRPPKPPRPAMVKPPTPPQAVFAYRA
ncbi:hypothetical protein MKQ68_20820 [Chitinophaga horti]|uniref:Uncharacterized protein n=1 Tax=Chitinophaga horti TaxID=2920382 RepID=A0ABY6J2E4_9BACT|nr:hypothetical protein [Chitinophaga horti]UYQ92531.1 hypothetical protein MKQ68_20820 [Chitinophaga horti]